MNRERLLQAEVWASFGKPLLLPVGPAGILDVKKVSKLKKAKNCIEDIKIFIY